MKYIIYKIINKINGKFYIGAHSTDCIDDDYMGSGNILKKAIEKYGKNNFEKEILEVFDNPEDMFKMESVLVDSDFVLRKDTYNLKEGGNGGWKYINKNKLYDTEKSKISRLKNLEKANEKNKELFLLGLNRRGFRHSIETRKKISLASKDKLSGDKNPSFGKIWINKNCKNVLILEKDLNDYIALGWSVGMDQIKKDRSGENNPQKGKIWITNGIDNKILFESDAIPFIDQGWIKGRTVKNN